MCFCCGNTADSGFFFYCSPKKAGRTVLFWETGNVNVFGVLLLCGRKADFIFGAFSRKGFIFFSPYGGEKYCNISVVLCPYGAENDAFLRAGINGRVPQSDFCFSPHMGRNFAGRKNRRGEVCISGEKQRFFKGGHQQACSSREKLRGETCFSAGQPPTFPPYCVLITSIFSAIPLSAEKEFIENSTSVTPASVRKSMAFSSKYRVSITYISSNELRKNGTSAFP